MSLIKATKTFDYYDDNGYPARKVFISPSVEFGEVVTGHSNIIINPEELRTAPQGDNGAGYIFSDLLTVTRSYDSYYFDKDSAFNYFEKLAGSLGYDPISFAAKLAEDIGAEIARNQPSGSMRLTDLPDYTSESQALWGADPQYVRPIIIVNYSGNQFNPSDFSRLVNVYIQFRVGGLCAFDNETGLWNMEGASSIIAQAFCIGKYNQDFFRTAISRVLSSLSCLYLKPAAGFGVLGGDPTWTFVRGGDFAQKVWVFGFMANDSYFCPEIGAINAIMPLRGNYSYGYNTTPFWDVGGDVPPDPPEPEPEPEPYPPTPPIPPTPDPPVPVDPVDPVPEPDDPPIGGADIGFMSIYNPDRSTLKRIAAQFWDPNALQAIKQYFTDPIDSIIGLSIVPVAPVTRAAEAVVIGLYNTHVGAPVVTTEYATHNCGSVYIPKFFNSYLDYDPYTKYQLYLPYIGEVELNADEITSKTITIKYKCNVVTGDCVALVMIGNNVFGTFNGNFSRQVPITAANYGAIISAAVNVATTAATVGVGVIGSQLTGEAIAENAISPKTQEITASGAIRATGAEVAAMNTAASGASSLVNNVMSAKASYKKSGNVGQGAGQISVRTPFITVTRPNLTLPENIDQASQSSLRRYVGYPTNKIGPLSSFHGLTVVESCQLNSQHATDGEIAEALEIMKGGVIL